MYVFIYVRREMRVMAFGSSKERVMAFGSSKEAPSCLYYIVKRKNILKKNSYLFAY